MVGQLPELRYIIPTDWRWIRLATSTSRIRRTFVFVELASNAGLSSASRRGCLEKLKRTGGFPFSLCWGEIFGISLGLDPRRGSLLVLLRGFLNASSSPRCKIIQRALMSNL